MQTACGIDFGTSNSTIGITEGEGVRMVQLEGGHTTIPSAIFYSAEGGNPIYGRAGVEAYVQHDPGRLLRSLKSVLGSPLANERTPVGGRYVAFEDILTGFVQHLKTKAEEKAGEDISHVVMGRPVHFVDNNPQADQAAQKKLEEIARKAGFNNVLFQLEPIAAALQFEEGLAEETTVFVCDIGGGTSDFSIVKVGPKQREKAERSGDILANEGVHIGGTNVDTRLSLSTVMPILGMESHTIRGLGLPVWPFADLATWHRIHTMSDAKNMKTFREILMDLPAGDPFELFVKVVQERSGHQVAGNVENAKIILTQQQETEIDLNLVEEGLKAPATRKTLETAIGPDLEEIASCIQQTLALAGLRGEAIGSVFLTGGTSAIPAVYRALVRAFPGAQVVEGDKFASVGYGLTLDAKRRFAQ